ncbi:SatD family protein [[Clostridium] fimetarium]|uniref:SatD family (SatD) n=1 Tax=[Clostridium] fimetarium TaxID=99656 RepID=A0A1I0NRH9_9FIRM|nr:SatD family protein [[Clostridium] fimetarium]SEW03907.1 SatD family (SatD) [[Clostridium] fimetarium]
MSNYVSLIIDIEKSRMYSIDERNEIQKYMSYCVERLNNLFKKNIELSVTFSAGDELQGLFDDATTAILYFRLFEMLMKPVKVRAGIGIGEWTVKVQDGLSTQQDGPVYHNARKAIEDVHKMQLQNVRICSGGDDTLANHLINSSISLKRQQIYMQNIVLVILELLYPFVTEKMKLTNYEIANELLSIKFEYKIGTSGYSRVRVGEKLSEKAHISMQEIPMENSIIIDGKTIEAEDAILKKNVSSVISKILGCTRQNVDSIIRRGNANKIRELDFMALQYVEKKYGGEIWN